MFKILSKPNCPYCIQAKQALNIKGLPYIEVIHDTETLIQEFKNQGYRTFPQVFHEDLHIGGARELQMYLIEEF